MVKSLSQLKKIEIRCCKLIEEIILTEESVEATDRTAKVLVPQLNSLRFKELPELGRFCAGHPIEFQSLKELYIKKCNALTTFVQCTQQVNLDANNSSEPQFLFNEMVGFPKLEELHLKHLDYLANIWHNQLMPNSFSKLKALVIYFCSKLLTVFSPHDLHRFRSLERLNIIKCYSVQEIFQFQESNAEEDTDVAVECKLRELVILDLWKLKNIWSKDPPTFLTFQEIQSVRVENCEDLKTIFPTSIAAGLSQLQSLSIERCTGVEGIIAKSENAGSDPYFIFSQLTSLTLDCLLKLKCLYPGRHSAEWPNLKCLQMTECDRAITFGSEIINPYQDEAHGGGGSHDNIPFQPFFVFEKLNPGLEELTLHHKDFLRIHVDQSPAHCFSKLKVLKLTGLRHTSVTVLIGFLKTLYCLEELVVHNGSFTELFSDEDAVFASLKHITISHASDLMHIWKQDVRLTRYLETLTIYSCDLLLKIVQSASSFRNLVTLIVMQCSYLKSLLTASTAKTMVNLTEMRIEDCDRITEVVEKDGDQTEDKVVFNRLKGLQLWGLKGLTSFCLGNHAFSFPLLEEVYVDGCPQMKIFSAGVLSTPKLRSIRNSKDSDNQFWEGTLNATIAYMFVERLLPQGVESHIKVSEFPALKEHWHDQHLGRHFLSVESLTVDGCASFTKALSANLLHSLNMLTTLEVRDCVSMEEVLDLEGMATDEGRVRLLPRLSKLLLIDLPMLRALWNKDPTKNLDFRNLTVLKLENCNRLNYAFTQSVSLCFVLLQEIHLKKCAMMEGIIKKGESDEVVPEIICPSLKKISIHDCPNVRTLFSAEQRSDINYERKRRLGKEEIDAPADNLKVLSNLEELSLDNKSTRIVVDCESPLEFFSKVKFVELISFPKKSCLFLLDFLRRLPNLEKLLVSDSSLKELFFLEGHDGAIILPQISCHHSASFQNLTTLDVQRWDKLMSLVPLSVAKNMVQLVTLRIKSCAMVTEIVGSGQDMREDEVVFAKLKYIELINLLSLSSFCPGSYIFNFPSLEQVYLSSCPNMRIFCPGVLRTPKLHGVRVLLSSYPGDLNATIQELHQKMVGFSKFRVLKLSRFPTLRENWQSQFPCKNISDVEKLVVDECASFSNALSSNHVRHLKRLKELVVQKCDSLEQVFEESDNTISLQNLQLIDLPRLRDVWNKDNLSLRNLRVLKVQSCSNLTHIFTESMALCLQNLQDLEVKRSCLVKHIITTGDKEITLEDKMIFPSLKTMTLHCLPNLLSVYSEDQLLKCSSLTYIDLTDCPNMNLFSPTQQDSSIAMKADHETFGMDILVPSISGGEVAQKRKRETDMTRNGHGKKVAFPGLKKLRVEWKVLQEMSGRFGIPFLGRLKAIELTSFPGEQAVLPSNFLQTLRVLEKLVLSDASFEEIIIDEVDAGDQILAHLRELKLCNLPNLQHLIMQNSRLALVIEHLEKLEVVKCGRFEVLVSSSLSFQYLITLEVSTCYSLRNLMTPAAARSLAQLKRIVIKECKLMQEIVSSEVDGVEDEIHLSRLEYFELSGLPCLTSFCSGRFTFNFPSLEEVIITECPKMETFSQGVVTTSKLQRVQTGKHKYEWEWAGSLNDTIRVSFMEMSAETTS